MSKIENTIGGAEGCYLSKMWIQIVKYRKCYQAFIFFIGKKGSPVFACYCMLLQVTAGYSKNVEYHAKTGPVIAGYYTMYYLNFPPFLHDIIFHNLQVRIRFACY